MEENGIMDVKEIMERIKDPYAKKEDGGKYDTRYDYLPSEIETVMEHADQFIIPECLDCCKLLWSKGIYTFQCGNYNDIVENGFWVEIDNESLSEENKEILRELSEVDSRVFFNEHLSIKHNYILRVDRLNNPNASQELCDLASKLSLQDTIHYTTDDELLYQYQSHGGELIPVGNGNYYYGINPERQNATLSDALKDLEHPELYIAEEGRLYHNKHALNIHINYLNKIAKSEKEFNYK